MPDANGKVTADEFNAYCAAHDITVHTDGDEMIVFPARPRSLRRVGSKVWIRPAEETREEPDGRKRG